MSNIDQRLNRLEGTIGALDNKTHIFIGDPTLCEQAMSELSNKIAAKNYEDFIPVKDNGGLSKQYELLTLKSNV